MSCLRPRRRRVGQQSARFHTCLLSAQPDRSCALRGAPPHRISVIAPDRWRSHSRFIQHESSRFLMLPRTARAFRGGGSVMLRDTVSLINNQQFDNPHTTTSWMLMRDPVRRAKSASARGCGRSPRQIFRTRAPKASREYVHIPLPIGLREAEPINPDSRSEVQAFPCIYRIAGFFLPESSFGYLPARVGKQATGSSSDTSPT